MFFLRISVAVFCAVSCHAQSLRVASATGSPGDTVRIELVLDPADARVSAAEWEITAPGSARGVEIQAPEIGAAARKAGKSISCAGSWKDATKSYRYRCLLAGGLNSIGAGAVAFMLLKLRDGVKPGSYPLKLENVKAVNPDAAVVSIKAVSGELLVQ
jgi:hypothetical protein